MQLLWTVVSYLLKKYEHRIAEHDIDSIYENIP